jgi:hypothetical protein
MDQLAEAPPASNPLGWARALSRRLIEPRGELREQVGLWLLDHRWRGHRRAWIDPACLEAFDITWATRTQALREAQLLLEARGWQLTGGARVPDSHLWSGDVFEVGLHGVRYFCTPAAALAREGLYKQPPPAVAPLITRPALRFVRGGKA